MTRVWLTFRFNPLHHKYLCSTTEPKDEPFIHFSRTSLFEHSTLYGNDIQAWYDEIVAIQEQCLPSRSLSAIQSLYRHYIVKMTRGTMALVYQSFVFATILDVLMENSGRVSDSLSLSSIIRVRKAKISD